MGVLSTLHLTKMGHIEDAPFWLNGRHKICEIYRENHLHLALHSTKIWHIEWGYYYNYVELVKAENMPKIYQVWTLTFFGVSSSNFFNKGLPNKILMFLSSVLIPLSNDTTFVDKKRCAN